MFNPGILYTGCPRCSGYLHVNCVRPHYESAHTDDSVPEHYGGIQSAQTNSTAVAVDDKPVMMSLAAHLEPTYSLALRLRTLCRRALYSSRKYCLASLIV